MNHECYTNSQSGTLLNEGKTLLQTKGAEMIVCRYELYPLGEFIPNVIRFWDFLTAH
jgi:hypothetical protein